MKRLALIVVLVAGGVWGQGSPATRPAFTIGKETTVVEGPLRADGTIDYVPAINKLIGGNVKNEANAAVPLLLLEAAGRDQLDAGMAGTLDALHVPTAAKGGPVVRYFADYLAHKNTGAPAALNMD